MYAYINRNKFHKIEIVEEYNSLSLDIEEVRKK
jgi:hypothetical protein